MLDTVKIQIDDYDIRKPRLKVQEGWRDTEFEEVSGVGPLYYEDDKWVWGGVAVAADANFHFEIKPKKQGTGEKRLPVASINWEVPRPINGHNFHPANHEETIKSFQMAQDFLTSRGVHCNLRDGLFVRMDGARNIETAQPFLQYADVMAATNAKRMSATDYPHGRLWKNGNRQAIWYDKLVLMVKQGHSIAGLPANMGRLENRINNQRSIEKAYGTNKVSDILENLDLVPQVYRRSMQDLIFRPDKRDKKILLANDIEADMRSFKESGSRYWVREFLMVYGMVTLTEAIDTPTFNEIVGKVADNRKMKSRLVKEFENMRWQAERMKAKRGRKTTLGQLYDELSAKILA